jgi:hypothetical protein
MAQSCEIAAFSNFLRATLHLSANNFKTSRFITKISPQTDSLLNFDEKWSVTRRPTSSRSPSKSPSKFKKKKSPDQKKKTKRHKSEIDEISEINEIYEIN